jgi:hypothetical protein
MAKVDPEAERRRLAEFYSHQLDGELEAVAKQAYELTDLAKESLRAELSRRGVRAEWVEVAPVPPTPPSPAPLPGDPPETELPAEEVSSADGEFELRRMQTVRQFLHLPDALLAKGSLESAGIEAVLVDDNIIRMDWFWSNLMGGIKLKVTPEEVESANQILGEPIPEGFEVAGIGEYQQPHCPKCHSLDINFQETAPAAYVSAYLNVPIPFHRRAWRCHLCDSEWEDDGIPGPTELPA